MGCVNNGEPKSPEEMLNKSTLTVATLNYCGIMNSPFEFYCQEYENQLKDISTIFLSLLPKYFPNFSKETFKWDVGKIDVKLRIGRYSPMFSAEVGVEQGKFLNRTEFQAKWDQVYEVEAKKINLQAKKNEKETTRLYDFITYHTLLKYVFKVETVEQALTKNPEVYLKTIRPFYELSFLNEERKVKKMVDNFAKLQCDIFFFQEYSEFFYNYLINRREHIIAVDEAKDTMIIAKEASFEKKKDIELIFRGLTKEQRDNLNSSETNAFLCVDNYILISSHLSSKTDKNKLQIEKLKVGLTDLKKHLPEYDIILGGDLNSYLPPFSKEFYFYPDNENQLTTIKKRTMTQGQFHKAEKIVEQSKDKIISTLKIDYASTMYINGRVPMKENYVPSNEHPFDHFVVVAKIHKRNKN